MKMNECFIHYSATILNLFLNLFNNVRYILIHLTQCKIYSYNNIILKFMFVTITKTLVVCNICNEKETK